MASNTHAEYGTCEIDKEQGYNNFSNVNIPGTSCQAILMLPLRFIFVFILFVLLYPLTLILALLRAIYLRVVIGRPSQILKIGAYGNEHKEGMPYPCQQLYKEPLDEVRLRKALVELCAEDGIEESDIDLTFMAEQPNDWPGTGSFDIDHFIESNKRPDNKGHSYMDYFSESKLRGEAPCKIKIHVWNGEPGKPTVMFFFGSGNRWDGSSNFNFTKELMNRYMGNPPNKVFQAPEILPASAAKFDEGSFLCFLLMMPLNLGRNWWMILWNAVRAARWAGGNGFGFKMTALNFTKEESDRLYNGAKALGVKPFALWTYAGAKACKEVLGQAPLGLTQQASLQTRHYPLPEQTTRDLVGDWLFGPVQSVPSVYDFKDAQAGYEELLKECSEIGPLMKEAIWAKAYGLINSGAAGFQLAPTYNVRHHPLNQNIFMNNYGIRTMPSGSPFHTHNWNAPLWFGINTINVDGRTTTLVGSMFWGLPVVEVLRDHMEATLREVMSKAPQNAIGGVPIYRRDTLSGIESVSLG
jgi:hypothetical protein